MTIARAAAWTLAACLSVSCGSAAIRAAHSNGGSPPRDARGVPIGGVSAGFQPVRAPNFLYAESLGVPGSGAFAGSGRARLEQQQDELTGQKPPAVIPEIPPDAPPPATAVDQARTQAIVPLVPELPPATPVAAPPGSPGVAPSESAPAPIPPEAVPPVPPQP
jgi:hypothetical protein